MKVLLLGTGAADGLPNAFCVCPTCRHARLAGEVRTRSGVLVDGVILIDPGPDCAAQASRAGVSLADVAHILITHNHPDHLDPSHLLSRSWVSNRPLSIHGPQGALDAIAPWLAPDSPVELLSLKAGEDRILPMPDGDTCTVRALAAEHSDLAWTPGIDDGSALLFDLVGPEARLLYLADTAPLADSALDDLASRGRADLILLEETFGTEADHGTGHHDLGTFARTCAQLRRRGIAGRIVPVHLSHHNPPKPELEQIMQGWGVELLDDLAEIEVGHLVEEGGNLASVEPASAPSAPLRTLVTGGARSGKSHWAEQSVLAHAQVRYIATSPPRPGDAEWQERVRIHQRRRPEHWVTVEGSDLEGALADPAWDDPGRATLIDCLSLWLTDVLDQAGAWDPGQRAVAMGFAEQRIAALEQAVREHTGTLVLVTNEVGSGVVPATYAGRLFADLLGITNRRIAGACDTVVLVTAGVAQHIKTPDQGLINRPRPERRPSTAGPT